MPKDSNSLILRARIRSSSTKNRDFVSSSAVLELFRSLLPHRRQPLRRHERAGPPPVQEAAFGGRVRRLRVGPRAPPREDHGPPVASQLMGTPLLLGDPSVAAAAAAPAGDYPVGRVVHPDGPDLSAGDAVGVRTPGRELKALSLC